MNSTIEKIGLCVLLFFSFTSLAQTNRYVDPAGTDNGDCSDPHNPCLTIQDAIDASSTNDIINLSDGTFAACDLSTRVTLSGSGSGTIVQTIDATAAVNGTDEIVIENLVISGGGSPGIQVAASYVTIDHVTVNGYSRNVAIDNATALTNVTITNSDLNSGTTGLIVTDQTALDQLTVLNTSMDNNNIGFYASNSASTDNNDLSNVLFRNCSFSYNDRKGFYAEKLQDALFENISIINSGVTNTYAFNNGIDINLKWQAYSNITIRNSRVIGCGAIGTNDVGTSPENRRSSAITIKARTDASAYDSPAASLTAVTLDGVIIDGLVGDLRFGEMGKTDNNGIDMSTVTVTHCSFANDNEYALVNEENTNTLTLSNNYWGGNAVSIDNYGTSASTSQSSELANEIVDETHASFANLAAAIAGSGSTIQNLPAGTISGTTTVDRALTLVSPGAGQMNEDSRTAFENLTVNGGDLTMGSDFAVSTTLDLTDNVLVDDYNLILEGTTASTGTITGSATGGLFIAGSGALASLSTSSAFEQVEINRSGTITLGTNLTTAHITLTNGLVDASAFDLIFTGLTALPGNNDSYIQGDFINSVSGSTIGNKLVFPVGQSKYRPVSIEGLDQSGTTNYTGDITDADPSGLSATTTGSNPFMKIFAGYYWTLTASAANVTALDKIIATYGSDDQVSDPNNIRVGQLQSGDWVNIGGSGSSPLASGASPPNTIDLTLGNFTLGDETTGTNFTSNPSVFVATTGSDANDGLAIGTPKLTLAAGLGLVSTAGTINVATGTYDETIEIDRVITLTGTGSPIVTGITLDADITFSDITATTVTVKNNSPLQDGLNLAAVSGTVNVEDGTFNEALTISKAVTLNGANAGLAGNYTGRTAESVIDPGSNDVAITVSATDVTIDGFQFGTDQTTSNVTTAITNTTFNNITIQHNAIYANSAGIALSDITSGSATLSENFIDMLDLEDQTNATNPSTGIYLSGMTGTVNASLIDNDLQDASFGIFIFNAYNTADNLLIDGGNYTGCVKGIEVRNSNIDNSLFGPSEVDIQDVIMTSFAALDADVAYPDAQAGVYAYVTGLATATDDIDISITNVDVSGVQSAATDYAAIYISDFQAVGSPYDGSDDDGIGVTATLTNSNIHDNENRGIYVRGRNASLVISQCTISNNGYNPNGNGYFIYVHAFGTATASNCFFTSPTVQLSSQFDGFNILNTDCSLTVTDSNINQNGNGSLAAGSGIDLSGNYFNSVDHSIIDGFVNSNDFTPYLEDGTDSNSGTRGFQPTTTSYYASALGAQTTGNRIDEAIGMVDVSGTVILNAGAFTETVTLNKSLTLNGSNVGIAGNGTRNAESIIDPGTQLDAITIGATDITIDGIQIGTDNTTSNALVGISNTSFNNYTVQNSIIYANSAGLSIAGIVSGTVSINNNVIDMIDLEDVSVTGNPSIGIYSNTLTGTVDVTYTDNDIQDASYGMLVYYANNAGDPLLIDGGVYTGCVKGIDISNWDGGSGFEPSVVDIQDVVMSAFAEKDPDVAAPDAQAGIYSFVSASSDDNTDDITVSLTNVEISGTTNTQTDYSAIYLGDFADDEFEITYTITDCNIHDNENRGIFATGEDAVANVSQSTISSNGTDPNGTGYGLLSRVGATINVANCFILNPSASIGSVNAIAANAGGFMTVTDCSFDQNGLDLIVSGTGWDLSGNYFNSTTEADINTWVSSNDFSPFITDGTDTDLVTAGFQPDFSDLTVSLLGAQTSGTRIQEAIDIVLADGTIRIPTGDYTGATYNISQNLNAAIGDPVQIDNLSLTGSSTLTLSGGTLLVDGSISLTSSIINVASGQITLNTAASDIAETSSAYVSGTVAMAARTIGTGSLDMIGVSIAGGADDLGNVSITRNTGAAGIITAINTSIAANWDISSDNPPTAGRDLTFTWPSIFDNAKDMTTMSVFSNSSGWAKVAGPYDVSAGDPRTTPAFNTTAFSIWSLAEEANPLPVELVSFQAARVADYVSLNWQTASEINSDYFEIQKSLDGDKFESVAKIPSHHNSNALNDYKWQDYSTISSGMVYYRLNMVDYDGTNEYSDIVSVMSPFESFIIYPNPASSQLNILSEADFEFFEVYNTSGRRIKVDVRENQIDVSNLKPGVYLLKMKSDTEVTQQKFIKK